MRLLDRLFRSAAPKAADSARLRDLLADAALALSEPAVGSIDPILRVAVEAATRITGARAALVVLGPNGRVERVMAPELDVATRELLVRAEVLDALGPLRTVDRVIHRGDLDRRVARTLRDVTRGGFVALPVARDGYLFLLGPVDADALAVTTKLARLAAAALTRARTAAAAHATCAELRRLCDEMLMRQDAELHRTARDLHEGVCQRLAAANAQLEALSATIETRRALERLRDARALLNQAVRELRELAQGLRPSVLENLGYVEALRWYLGRLRERAGVAPSLEIEGAETRLPIDVEGALYRATEEAVEPAVTASALRALRVRYRREREGVRIEIAGPPPEAINLVAIRERLRPFGGGVQVSAAPDRTPVIEVQIPAPVD